MIEVAIITVTLILISMTITKLKDADAHLHDNLGGDKVLYWPPAGIKFIYYVCSGKLFGVFKNFPMIFIPYVLFFEFWIFVLHVAKTRIMF
jgi:hypothetical protein